MRLAETVTFGGSGLDRAQELRADEGALAALRGHAGTGVVPVWRGRPLVAGPADGALRLVRLPIGHPALADAATEVLLGREDGAGIWAGDLSRWAPESGVPLPAGAFDAGEQTHPLLPPDHRFADLRSVMTRLSPRDAELAATAKALIGWHETHGFCARCGAASTISEGGWQRRCPACNAQHFPRTDPVVIMLVTSGNDLLLGRSPGWPAGMFSLLAGFVEPGETVEAAVRREVAEETGVRVGPVGYLASQPWPFPASLMLGCRGDAESREITLDPVELEAAMWVSRERLARAMAGEDAEIRAPRAGAIAGFLMRMWLADRLD